jgi:hypothetical protein
VTSARRIYAHERDAALRTVVDAFRRDPQVRWWFPDDDVFDVGAPAFFGVLLDTRIEGGEVWVVDGLAAVSMWIPPGGNLLGPDVVAARYSEVVANLPGPAPQRIQETDELVDELLPTRPHWYLGVLACQPGQQRRGLGSAVLQPVFESADRAGVPVALETSTVGNVDFYIRRGFAVHAVVRPPAQGAPEIRVMCREPVPPPRG